MFLLEVVQKFQDKNISFALAGGYAVVLHGAVRGTIDIDLVVTIDLTNLEKVETAIIELGLTSRIPIRAKEIFQFRKDYIQKRNLIAWSFVDYKNPAKVIDIIITHDLKKMKTQKISAFGIKLPVLTKAELIKMKRQAGRPQDIEDIKALESKE